MTRLVVVLALATACASAPPATRTKPVPRVESAPRAPTIHRDARVDRAMRAMAVERELPVMRDVGAVVVSRDELVEKLREHVAREVPRAEIESESALLATLGVLARGEDYEREVYAAVRRDAGGMYLPEHQTMYLPDDLDDLALATTIAHEAVHALQDQHFGLERFERWVPGASDTMLAWSCLAEGDAVRATKEQPVPPEHGSYVARELAAPYVFGAAFVGALRARGGWAEVDRAWRRGALTTEQVLHPDKWAANEVAVSVKEPTFAALGPSFVRIAADTHGELGLLLVLEAGVPEARAAAGAAGWAGDTSVLVRGRGGYALAWRIRWDDDASATRGADVVAEALAGGRPCRDERASPTSVTRSARDVLVLVGPEGSRCGLLDAWSKEVFAR